ncbi:unnamed protein product [Nyctereutes procyonoides]|uniref:(raccoon dog) hypothetical protein n=1 Tax=Nyctereutes procyonoides TaxID=34880 RepID=A0A811ZY54_NYCPR|nr:unnamed protein product [Nyctereutes procyonoides]
MDSIRNSGKQRKKISLVLEDLLKKRKAYQTLKAIQTKFLSDSWKQQHDSALLRQLERSETSCINGMSLLVQRTTARLSVWELILKHGQGKIKNKIILLTDNTVIEKHLEKYGKRVGLLKEVGLLGYGGECTNQLIWLLN